LIKIFNQKGAISCEIAPLRAGVSFHYGSVKKTLKRALKWKIARIILFQFHYGSVKNNPG